MGQLPVDNQAAGLPSPEQLIGNYVTSLTVENGAVHIALGNQVDSSLAGKQLSLRPATIAANPYGSISWLCGYTPPAAGMTAQGTNRTSVPAMYLPAQCGGPTNDPTAVIRAQVVEALNLAAEVKVAVAEYYASTGQLPVDNQAAGLPSPEQLIGNYVTSLTVENGAIHIALGNQVGSSLAGKQLSLRPATIAANPYGSISWVCGYAPVPTGMTAHGTNLTSVPTAYLPLGCRSL